MKLQSPFVRRFVSTGISPILKFQPARIVEVDIDRPLSGLSGLDKVTGRRYERVIMLVRLHSQPLGQVELSLGEESLSAAECAHQIWQAMGHEIIEHLQKDGLPEIAGLEATGIRALEIPKCLQERHECVVDAQFVSIVVPTRNRPERIVACVRSLLALDYPHYEIIVVDNAPSSEVTAEVITAVFGHTPQVRYVREDRAGKSWALNRGIIEARGEIIACTDDDVIFNVHWLTELMRGFRLNNRVACVTGAILPAELETQAQAWTEEFGGFNKGFRQLVFNMEENRPHDPLYPYAAGKFGSGANIAFRASFLREIGGYDPALGPATPALGGEDLAMLFQVIIQGYTLVYQPSAYVRHLHYREFAKLQHQIYSYGVALTAYLTKCLLDNPKLLFDFASKVPYGLYFSLSPGSPKNSKKHAGYPKELTYLELRGMLYGPLAYLLGLMRVWHTLRIVCKPKISAE